VTARITSWQYGGDVIKEHSMDEKLQEEMSEAPVDHEESLRKIGDQLNAL
jgi:hypothetical protein